MKRISELCTGIHGNIATVSNLPHIHFPQTFYDLFTGIFFSQLFFQDPIDQKSDKAGKEMSLYSVITLKIYGPCFKLGFHDAE